MYYSVMKTGLTLSLRLALGLALLVPLTGAALHLTGVIALQGETHHVQGIEVRGDRLWVTSVDARTRRGFLYAFDLPGGVLRQSLEIQDDPRYHPGGISIDGESLWVPLAEYRPQSTSIIQERDLRTGRVTRQFAVPDHIGCVAVQSEYVIGANWDARDLYAWDRLGRLLWKKPNPTGNAFQDMKFSGGHLVGSGLLAGNNGAIDWLEFPSLRLLRRIPVGRTDRGIAYTHEGMSISGDTVWLLPEDTPSRLFTFHLSK
jgi:hypothetical protein